MSNLYLTESLIKLNVVKQKIIQSLLVYNYELISMCFARIYTASATSKSWLYTELEGGLTLVIDYARKSARFLLFDLNTLEIIFECELYRNFNLFYSSITETLQCFEVSKGFIGFSIPDINSAQNFFKSVSKLTDSLITKKIKEKIILNKTDLKSNSAKVLALIKEKLAGEYFFKDNVLNEKKLELDLDNIEKMINMIEYDNEHEKFLITGNADEIEHLVGKVKSVKYSDKNGLKITDTVAYAMEIYQSMMNSMAKNNEIKANKTVEVETRKTKLLEKIKHEVYGEGDCKKIEQTASNNVSNVSKGVPQAPAKGVPQVPAMPKGVPPVPKGVPAVPKGVPPVPKGVPPVPKGVPAVSVAIKTQTANLTSQNANTVNTPTDIQNNPSTTNTTANPDEIVDIQLQPTPEAVEEKKQVRRKEPKMDMMTELRMKLANRGNLTNDINPNTNHLQPNNITVKPPTITNMNTNTILPNASTPVISIINNGNNNAITNENEKSKQSENAINPDTAKPISNVTNAVPNIKIETAPQRKSNLDVMKEALNRKFGGAPTKKEEIKPIENNNPTEPKPIISTAPSSNVGKMNMNKMIEQMEKSYNGGNNESKEEPKQSNIPNKTPIEKKPTINPTPVISVPSAGNIPKAPGVPLPPPLNIPLPPKINIPAKPTPKTINNNNKPELTLSEQISKGVALKSVETVEKTGIDFLKKREDSIPKNIEPEKKTEVKGDLFAEMRKVQLKKLNK